MVCPTGIEPVTPSLEGWCSIRLSYGQIMVTRPYTNTYKVFGLTFIFTYQILLKSNKSKFGRRGEIRTPDILLPKQARYQATLHAEGQKYTVNRVEGQIYYDKMYDYF
jgi:hypothetical protein